MALIMGLDRLQRFNKSYKIFITMQRRKVGIRTGMSSSTKNSTELWRTLKLKSSGINDGTKVCHFLQGIRSSELETVLKNFCMKPKKG